MWRTGTLDGLDHQDDGASIHDGMTVACDIAMLRAAEKSKKSVYWWSDELAVLREHITFDRR